LARRVIFEGLRAVGLEIDRGGRVEVLRARKEIIIAASAINSPKLLKLSGIGPGAELSRHGIAVIAERAGVGENLQDHLEVYLQAACKLPITLHKHLGLVSKGLIGLRWLLFKNGLGATNHFESCGFIRSGAGVKYPDIQYHFLPAAIRYDGRAAAKGHGFQVHVGPMRSKSRGSVRLKSPDPKAAPAIQFNYMSQAEDWRDFRTCIRLTRELFKQPAMAPYFDYEIQPGAPADSDEGLDHFIKEHVESAYHPCGTCRMGAADDPLAVVDPQCQVIGVEGLRVADSSIFPQVTNGNLNAPSIMTGEKAADHILGRELLAASNQAPWVHPDWQTAQR
jgi:choline dehydrogenase